jgi:hypothetical protein
VNDAERIAELEDVLAQFLKPLKNLPFPIVIRAMANQQVIPVDRAEAADRDLIQRIEKVAKATAAAVRERPIRRNRPNEVGNDIEPYVMEAAGQNGLRAERPRGRSGRAQQTGYPDILLFDGTDRPTYLECKIFGEGSALTTMRSFYLSPSENFKVCHDARHLLLAFSVQRAPISGSRDSLYTASGFKLLDLHGLKCDVKYEFNSDNQRLYAADMILTEGRF